MKFMKGSCFTGSLLLLGVLVLTLGCGLKTNPVPPQTVVPRAIDDLRYSLDDKGATLTWSYPLETIEGENITEILGFDLYRAEIPLEDFCSNCPIPFAKPLELPGGAAGVETRTTARHVSGLLRSGNKYFFKVTSRTSYFASSADSNIVTFVYHTPAAAPQNVTTLVGKDQVKLSWAPVTTLIDGKAADLKMNYQVLRSLDGKQFAKIGAAQPGTTYVDKKVQSGKTYYYAVETLMRYQDEILDGSRSEAVPAKVLDIEPPKRVTGVTVIASAKNYRVFWDSINIDDLAGYRIYRRLDGEKKMVKIAEVGRTQTLFIDETVPADAKVFYSVSAFDTQNNEGKLSEEATTRH